MTRETALEFYTFNIIGAWVGKQTPIFIEKIGLSWGETYERKK